jgi:hypothetical protein
MPSKGVVQWSANWFGPDLVKAAYRGLAGRSPTEDEVQTQVAAIKREGKVSAVIQDISHLPEAWARNLHSQPAELVRQLYRGVNGEDPDAASLAAGIALLAQRPDLPTLVSSLLVERRRRLGLLEIGAASIVQAAFKTSLGRPADPHDLEGFSAQLLASGDVRTFLEEVETCAEHRAKFAPGASVEDRSLTVSGLYRGLPELAAQWQVERRFLPTMPRTRADELMARWEHAVRQAVAP